MSSTQRAYVHTQRALSCSWYIHTRWQWREGLPISSRENILQRERVLGIVGQSSMTALPLRLWAGLSCQRTCVQWHGKSMNQCPACRQCALPKLRSVKIQSVTLITQVPSQVCKYNVMCMELRTCHAESLAGLQIYIICESIWSCAPCYAKCYTESLRTVCKYNARIRWGNVA